MHADSDEGRAGRNDLFHIVIVNASEAAQRPKDTPHTVRHVTRRHDRRKAARDLETWMRDALSDRLSSLRKDDEDDDRPSVVHL